MKLVLSVGVFAAMATVATAFQSPVIATSLRRSAPLQIQKLNDVDEMCIENVAEICLRADEALAQDCDLEEHEALVNQLEDQRTILLSQVDRIDNLLLRLKGEAINGLVKEQEETYFAG